MKKKFNEEILYEHLNKLEYWKQLVFLITISQRLVPNFLAFEKETDYKGGEKLVSAIEKAWSFLLKGQFFIDLSEEQLECENLAPDTEDYETVLVSPALDAAVAVSLLMKAFSTHDTHIIVEATSLMNDTLDMYIQELMDIDTFDPDIEEKIEQHPLMQKELKRQTEDLSFLLNLDRSIVNSISIAYEKWFKHYSSCLNL